MSSTYNSSKAVSWLGFVGAVIIAIIALGFLVVTDAGTGITAYLGTIGTSAAFLAEHVGYSSAFLFAFDVVAQRWLDLLITLLVLKASYLMFYEWLYARRSTQQLRNGGSTSVVLTDFNRVTVYLKVAALLSVVYFVFHAYNVGC